MKRRVSHRNADLPLEFKRDKKHVDEEEFVDELSKAGHGSGNTESEKPKTFEHTQEEAEEAELIDNEILDRQIDVKGESCIPMKLPAKVIFVPTTFCKVIFSKIGSALGSKLSSGWDPDWPVALNALKTLSISTSDMIISLI